MKIPSKTTHSLSLLCWAYNEEENVEAFLAKSLKDLERVCDDFEIVIIDDGSTDRTAELVKKFASQDHRIRLIQHPRNLNVGACTKTAIKAASKEILFWNTVDNSYDTADLDRPLAYLDSYDIVQRVRIGGGSDNRWKKFVSRVNYWLIRLLSGVPLTDFQNCTFHRSQAVKALKLESNSSVINPEMLIKRYYQGARIKEVPIKFTPRQKGEAKGTKWRFLLRSASQVLWYVPRWRLAGLIKGRPGKVSRYWED